METRREGILAESRRGKRGRKDGKGREREAEGKIIIYTSILVARMAFIARCLPFNRGVV